MSSRFLRRLPVGPLLGIAVIVSACGSSSSSAIGASSASVASAAAPASPVPGAHSPNPPDLVTFTTIEKQVEAIRGLHPKRPSIPFYSTQRVSETC
jgi:hypothetical protein